MAFTDTHHPGHRDPLHGITLESIITRLAEHYGWETLGQQITIKCFTTDPSISSCLKFLRKTPWARQKVEKLYLETSWPTNPLWDTARQRLQKNKR
ncbi:MAG TPA: DUF2132 domain-containing protein [Gammaproteobacteria bacterium]|nr:DUF2132 domain-containing protein [Gammaproteobacteria bacterium]